MNIFNEYMYRSPLLSLDEFNNIQKENLTDKEYTKHLINYVEKNNLYANIYSSSKVLYFALINFNDSTSDKKTKSILKSLYKYLIRMIFRATPFGMYSGVGVNNILKSDDTSANEEVVYYGYLNNYFLYYLIDKIHNNSKILNKLKLRRNPIIYSNQKNVFLPYQVDYSLNEVSSSDNVSLKKNILIDRVLELSESIIEFEKLQDIISFEFEASEEIVINYIKKLIKEDFLITDFKINLSKKDAFKNIIFKLEELKETDNEVYEILCDVAVIINKIKDIKDRQQILELLINADEIVKKIFPDFKENVINIDTKLKGRNIEITEEDINNVKSISTLISQLTIFEPSKILEGFKNKFSEIYGENEDVQILELLNSSTGLGIPKEYSVTNNLNNLNKANTISGILENWKTEALINQEDTIKLTDQRLKDLKPYLSENNINTSFDIFFVKIGNTKSRWYLKTNSGSLQATQTYGRFLYMFNQKLECEINEFCKRYVPEMIHKEIIYNHPNPKIQNVMSSTFDTEVIDFLGDNGNIKIQDLYICLGEDSNFYIKDKKTKDIIFPDFKNMHNTNLSPAIIRFLSDISLQYSSGGYFLNYSATEHAFSPRIEYKNIVISPRKWHMNFEKNLDFKNFKNKLSIFKGTYNLDSTFYVINEDHKLYIDINYDISLQILYEQYKRQDVLEVEEVEEELSFNKKVDINEIVFSVSHTQNSYLDKNVTMIDKDIRNNKEVILPGNNWVCLNLYYDEYNFEEFMKEGIWRKIFNKSCEFNDIDTIFFIRYFDADPHIRLRFKINCNISKNTEYILTKINKFKKEGYIKTFSIVPYYRESNRYGGNDCINLAEKCFQIDSKIVAKYYGMLDSEFNKINFAIDNVLEILTCFNNNIDVNINILSVFGKNKENKDLYREKRNRVFNSISNNDKYMIEYGIEGYRNRAYKEYITMLDKEGKSNSSDIILSVIHMFCNRLFGTDRNTESKVLEIIYRSLLDYRKINNL